MFVQRVAQRSKPDGPRKISRSGKLAIGMISNSGSRYGWNSSGLFSLAGSRPSTISTFSCDIRPSIQLSARGFSVTDRRIRDLGELADERCREEHQAERDLVEAPQLAPARRENEHNERGDHQDEGEDVHLASLWFSPRGRDDNAARSSPVPRDMPRRARGAQRRATRPDRSSRRARSRASAAIRTRTRSLLL